MVNQITSQYPQVYTVNKNASPQKQKTADTFKSLLDDASQSSQSIQASGKDKSQGIKSGTGKNSTDDSSNNVKDKQAGAQGQTQFAAANANVPAQAQVSKEAAGNSVPQLQNAVAALSVSGKNNSTNALQSKSNAAVNENTVQQKQLSTVKNIAEETSSQTTQKAQASSENAKNSNLSGQLKQGVSTLSTGQQENKTGTANTNAFQQVSQYNGTAAAGNIKSAYGSGTGNNNSGSSLSGSGKDGNQPGSEKETANISQLSTSARQSANLYTDGNIVVKISDAPAKAKVPAFRQVADNITTNLNNDKHEFQVNLYPQSLGKVSVKLTSESGILTVVIAASNPKTQSILASNSGDIKTILQASTGQQNVQIVNHSRQDSAAWYDGNQHGGGYNGNGNGNQEDNQQQRQNRHTQKMYGINGTSFSAGDFLTMINSAASAPF